MLDNLAESPGLLCYEEYTHCCHLLHSLARTFKIFAKGCFRRNVRVLLPFSWNFVLLESFIYGVFMGKYELYVTSMTTFTHNYTS